MPFLLFFSLPLFLFSPPPPPQPSSSPPAPCSLSSITAFAQCHNSSILVEWQPLSSGPGNPVYTATAEGSDRSFLSCNSSSSSCVLQGALCGLQYSVIVAPSSDTCSVLRSAPYRISMGKTGPWI